MKILVVDDEQELGVLLGIALRRLGHVPLLALHADDALAMMTSDIDAVITDIDMPMMNGLELARAIRSADAQMPIAFCTGSDPAERTVREAAEIGRVMSKVWTLQQVEELVQHLAATAAAQRSERRQPRFRTRLRVTYNTAAELIRDYTENLSRGGMFLRGAHNLTPMEEVEVIVAVPGCGEFPVRATVRYVLDERTAAAHKRRPGAGLSITSAPAGFRAALEEYVARLERRWEHIVYATDEQLRRVLAEAGFRALEAPPPHRMVKAFASSKAAVLGVVVTRRSEPAYATAIGDPSLVFGIDYVEELEELIPQLDAQSGA